MKSQTRDVRNLAARDKMSMNAIPPAGRTLQNDIEGVIVTLEHLAVQAAHAQEPCAQILFRTAELLRVTVLTSK